MVQQTITAAPLAGQAWGGGQQKNMLGLNLIDVLYC